MCILIIKRKETHHNQIRNSHMNFGASQFDFFLCLKKIYSKVYNLLIYLCSVIDNELIFYSLRSFCCILYVGVSVFKLFIFLCCLIKSDYVFVKKETTSKNISLTTSLEIDYLSCIFHTYQSEGLQELGFIFKKFLCTKPGDKIRSLLSFLSKK